MDSQMQLAGGIALGFTSVFIVAGGIADFTRRGKRDQYEMINVSSCDLMVRDEACREITMHACLNVIVDVP